MAETLTDKQQFVKTMWPSFLACNGILSFDDGIQNYRLEMGISIKIGKANFTVQVLGDTLAKTISQWAHTPIINLVFRRVLFSCWTLS